MICTLNATVLTFNISQKEFPDIHGLHNKANAFRHALWNMLILNRCHKIDKHLESILIWTKRITDWHEEFSPNKELMRVMDLHNNKIGRDMYCLIQDLEVEKLQVELMKKVSEAILVTSVDEIAEIKDSLVYLKD